MIAQIADREQSTHLSAKTQPVQAEFFLTADSLPYEKLGGPGFERLCYLLLLTRGHSPLFFGDTGQAQRGIDLLVEEDGSRVVYQCKNVKNFSLANMIAALEKFEVEWLQQTDLPKPEKFVLCLSRSLSDVKDLEPWENCREEFSQKHKIEVAVPWDRNYLNEVLKQRPDIVAEIFSDQIAELFCERDDWDFDQFHPVVVTATEPSLKRYFARKTSDRLYLDPQLLSEFTKKIESNGSALIKGLPGSGKTITSLALTEELEAYRVYYLSLRENISNDTLIRGIKDRLSRRTLFVFDDCQGKFPQLDRLMVRIQRLLYGRPVNQALFIFVSRTTPTPGDLARGDVLTGFEEDLAQAEAVLKFAPNEQTFRQIIRQGNPEFDDLTPKALKNLYEFTGHDLVLLDQLLHTLTNLEQLDDLNLGFLLRKTIGRYFGSDAVDRPGFMHLAALAQFDLAPKVAGFPYNLYAEDAHAMAELVAAAGHPLHFFFLHSSAAELIFRALAINHGITNHIENAAEHLIAFFTRHGADEPTLTSDLWKVFRNSLKLLSKTEDMSLKSIFLANEEIYDLLERNFGMLPLNMLAVCRFILANTNSTALARYEGLVHQKVEDGTVLHCAISKPYWDSKQFFWLIKRHYPELLETLRNQLAATEMHLLAPETRLQTFLALLSLVAEPQDIDWQNTLSLIPDAEVEMMFARTVTAGSIGGLDSTLRELKQSNETLLRQLEEKISAPRFLRLIAANGTLFELLRVIRNSTLELAEEIVTALDDQLVEQIIAQTITSGRSIGTLNFTLRELKESNHALLRRMEVKISAPRFLQLIVANGTFFELFRVIQHSTLELGEEIIAALDDQLVEQLMVRTISTRRSIGTLHFTLRELKQKDETLLRRLEEKIGAPRFLRLITANGTIFELFSVIKNSTLELAKEIVAALDDQLVEQIIAQTITSGRSIGTLDLTLRELKESDQTLLRCLEEKISAPRFIQLIVANGTFFELFRVIQHSTLELGEKIIAALDDQLVEQLMVRTISTRRSIGTLHFTLRELKQSDETLLRRLEEKIGAPRFLRLITANGRLFELFSIIGNCTLKLAGDLIAALDHRSVEEVMARTVASGRSIGSLHLTLRYLRRVDTTLYRKLEETIGANGWWRLTSSFGSVSILAGLLPAMDRSAQRRFIKVAKKSPAKEWEDLFRQNGFYELCYLVKNLPWFFSESFRPDFLKPILVNLVQISNWEARNSGWLNLFNAPDSIGKEYLLKLLDEYVTGTDVSTVDFPTFSEAAHGITLLWRLLPEQRSELADVLLRFLRTVHPIYSDPTYLRSVRGLFSILTTPESHRADSRLVLSIGNDARVATLCTEATTLDLFLYLWNLFALWFEWRNPQENSFADFLNMEFRDALNTSLIDRLGARNDRQEADNLIALAGVMSFLGVTGEGYRKVEDFLLRLPSLNEMISSLDNRLSFISSVFFLLGLEWMYEGELVVPAETWRQQLSKAGRYSETTAALEYLKSLITIRSQSASV
jgi:uncharacterized protein YoaH (UPF0181 family)